VAPRQEQLIRARRAAELGLIEMFLPEEADDALKFAAALKALPEREPPSKSNPDLRLEGLPHISAIVESWFDQRTHHHLSVVEG
jgi:predicted glycosyltransferase